MMAGRYRRARTTERIERGGDLVAGPRRIRPARWPVAEPFTKVSSGRVANDFLRRRSESAWSYSFDATEARGIAVVVPARNLLASSARLRLDASSGLEMVQAACELNRPRRHFNNLNLRI